MTPDPSTKLRHTILEQLEQPAELERLYRDHPSAFKKAFESIYPEIQENLIAQCWKERLQPEAGEMGWGKKNEWFFILTACLLAGFVAKIPQFFGVKEEIFYPRNISFIVFPFLSFYFLWKQEIPLPKWILVAGSFLITCVYINLLPKDNTSDTLMLACIHLPFFLWSVMGFSFTGKEFSDHQKRLDLLKYMGDLMVMMAILLIAGALLTSITLGLFQIIDVRIEKFYFQYIAVWGVSSIPIIGTWLVRSNPRLVSKVSPIIARIFAPLVLVMLMLYLIAILYTGKDPYNDREFLIVFNVLLISVMALIFFSLSGIAGSETSKFQVLLLFSLSVITIVINGIALSAILFRIGEWGITPNRLAVLGGNTLILTNLSLVSYQLFMSARENRHWIHAEERITSFLPLYAYWSMTVIFLFPLLFGFK